MDQQHRLRRARVPFLHFHTIIPPVPVSPSKRLRSHTVAVHEPTPFGKAALLRLLRFFIYMVAKPVSLSRRRAGPFRAYFPRFCTSSSIRRFQSAPRGREARTLHTASPMTS